MVSESLAEQCMEGVNGALSLVYLPSGRPGPKR